MNLDFDFSESEEVPFDANNLLQILKMKDRQDSKSKILLKPSLDFVQPTKLVTCVYCGKNDLYWYKHPGSIRRLFCNETDDPHVCEGYRFLHRMQLDQIKEYLKDKEKRACLFCGQKDLHWIEESSGEWRLYDSILRVHECSAYWKHLNSLEENE